MTELPPEILKAFALNAQMRAQDRAEAFARFTPREQRLIHEAAVMGFVRGARYESYRRADEPEIPRDAWIVEQVLAGCLSFEDLYSLIALGEMPGERYEGEGGNGAA